MSGDKEIPTLEENAISKLQEYAKCGLVYNGRDDNNAKVWTDIIRRRIEAAQAEERKNSMPINAVNEAIRLAEVAERKRLGKLLKRDHTVIEVSKNSELIVGDIWIPKESADPLIEALLRGEKVE